MAHFQHPQLFSYYSTMQHHPLLKPWQDTMTIPKFVNKFPLYSWGLSFEIAKLHACRKHWDWGINSHIVSKWLPDFLSVLFTIESQCLLISLQSPMDTIITREKYFFWYIIFPLFVSVIHTHIHTNAHTHWYTTHQPNILSGKDPQSGLLAVIKWVFN